MARAGRKRKIGAERFPGGQVKPEEHVSPTQAKRLMMAALAGMADPQWGTIAGRYFLTGGLSSTEYEACRRYAVIRDSYARAMMGPPPPRTSSGQRGSLSGPVDPDSDMGASEAEAHQRAIKRYLEAQFILKSQGPAVEIEVSRFAGEHGAAPTFEELRRIRLGLRALASLWRMSAN